MPVPYSLLSDRFTLTAMATWLCHTPGRAAERWYRNHPSHRYTCAIAYHISPRLTFSLSLLQPLLPDHCFLSTTPTLPSTPSAFSPFTQLLNSFATYLHLSTNIYTPRAQKNTYFWQPMHRHLRCLCLLLPLTSLFLPQVPSIYLLKRTSSSAFLRFGSLTRSPETE